MKMMIERVERGKTITFKKWLVNQEKRNDAVGDLARDVKYDSLAPGDNAGLDTWINHLKNLRGSQDAIVVLKRAYREFSNL
jgi:hypothetical protein